MIKTYAGMALTVGELIKLLDEFDPQYPVMVEGRAAAHVYIFKDAIHVKPRRWGEESEPCQQDS